jgi:ketosteroid isomerase-like protein
MNSDHVAIVKQLYDAFARGDVPAVLGAFDPNIRWQEAEGFVYADGNPYVGPEAVLQGVFGRLAGEWDNFTVHPREISATPDGAVTEGRYTGTYKATGRRIDAQFAHVWRISDGKVSGFQQYTDTAQFHDAIRK